MDKNMQEQIRLIKEHMCDDLNADACKELIEVLKTSKNCKVYFDTIKKTVVLCRDKECPENLPEDMNRRLFEALGLQEFKDAHL
jgi:hypothetical protein